jgi:hypothetical protein
MIDMSVASVPTDTERYSQLRRDLDGALDGIDTGAVDKLVADLAQRVAAATGSGDVAEMHSTLGDLARLRRRASRVDSDAAREAIAEFKALARVLDHASTVALVRRDQREVGRTTVADQILELLSRQGAMRAADLVTALGADKSYISKVISKLRDDKHLIQEVPAPSGQVDDRAKWLAVA